MEFSFQEANELIIATVQQWFEALATGLPNFLLAIFVFVLFYMGARLSCTVSRRVFIRTLDSQEVAGLLSAVLKGVVLAIGLFVSLGFMGLQGTVTSLLAGAGIIGLALGFAFQDMTENFIAGIFMGIRKPFRIGDVVQTGGVFGEVENINLRNTLVRNFDGQRVILPNKSVFTQKLENYSVSRKRKIVLEVGVSYADDPDEAKRVIQQAIAELDCLHPTEEVKVFAKGFGASSVDLEIWYWVLYPYGPDYFDSVHEGVVTTKQAIEQAGMTIPFPIRTLDFGIRGGEKLNQVLPEDAEYRSKQEATD